MLRALLLFEIIFVSPDVYALKRFGEGSGSVIVLDNVQCTGNEASLSNCSALSVHNCEHSQDAGVRCLNGKFWQNFTPSISTLRLDDMFLFASGTFSFNMY